MTAEIVAAVLWTGVTAYAIFGGADFGAGFWDLFAGGSQKGAAPRELMDEAIGPVWEANHTWLIFDLVVLWTAFSEVFASVMTTLYVPLTLAAIGIVLRGSGFAFRRVTKQLAGRRLFGATFALSSVVTPFFLGAVLGAIASGRVPLGQHGDPITSWVNPTAFLTGFLAVATCAYLAAVFMVHEAHRNERGLERYFEVRAIGASIGAGLLALVGIYVLSNDAPFLFEGLTNEALPFVIVSAICGLATLAMLWKGMIRGTRVLAVLAVAAIIWAWGVAQHPYLLPGEITIQQAAGAEATMVALLVVFALAAVFVVPSLIWLYRLADEDRLEATEG